MPVLAAIFTARSFVVVYVYTAFKVWDRLMPIGTIEQVEKKRHSQLTYAAFLLSGVASSVTAMNADRDTWKERARETLFNEKQTELMRFMVHSGSMKWEMQSAV
jgi:hypothetical protein